MKAQKWILLSLVVMSLVSAVSGQKSQDGSVPDADKVQVIDFSLNPTQPACNQPATVKMVIKNLSKGSTLKVPWKISVDGQILGSNVRENVAPGSSFEVSATWIKTAGTHQFVGAADPDNTLGETLTLARANNSKSLSLASGLAPGWLFFQKAQAAGAVFVDNRQSAPTTCTLRQADSITDYPDNTRGVLFVANCKGSITGGKADFEAFKNFRLKNGWKIKGVDILPREDFPKSGGDFVAGGKPVVGSDNPFMKFGIWADAGGRKEVIVAIRIEGPECTDPYR